MTDYSELKRLAEAATAGPWIAAGPSFGSDKPQYLEEILVDREGDEDDTYTVCKAPTGLEKESTADMEFIAAANPSAVLALIAENEANQERADAEQESYDGQRRVLDAVKAERDQLKAELEDFKQGAKAEADAGDEAKSEVRKLKAEVEKLTAIAYGVHGAFRMETMQERDQLKAENEALRKDAERLKFVLDEGITISMMNGTSSPTVYRCQWHDCAQVDWFPSPTDAIDAAMSKEPEQ